MSQMRHFYSPMARPPGRQLCVNHPHFQGVPGFHNSPRTRRSC